MHCGNCAWFDVGLLRYFVFIVVDLLVCLYIGYFDLWLFDCCLLTILISWLVVLMRLCFGLLVGLFGGAFFVWLLVVGCLF